MELAAEVVAQVRRDRHDVVARHHQRLAGPGAVLAALLQHVGEARPFLRALVLAAELALAVAPAAVGDHGGDALVDAAGVNGNGAAEARSDQADARGVDRRVRGEEGQRAAGILDLLQADHAAVLAFAVAAAAHVEAQHDVAEIAQHLGRLHRIRRGLVAAEAVQHQEGGALLAGPQPARDVHDAGEFETGGRKGDGFFGHRQGLRCGRVRGTLSERCGDGSSNSEWRIANGGGSFAIDSLFPISAACRGRARSSGHRPCRYRPSPARPSAGSGRRRDPDRGRNRD